MSFENWLFWWAYNKDEILNLKAALRNRDAKSLTRGSGKWFLGDGDERNKKTGSAPNARMIDEQIIPALLAAVHNKGLHSDIRGGAAIALARCGTGAAYLKTFFELADPARREDKLLQESAILAIGILGRRGEEVRTFLTGLADDTADVSFRARCFAMLSLGLLADRHDDVFACLERRIDGSESMPDLPVCAFVAMGLIGDESRIPTMSKWLVDGRVGRHKLSDLEKAYLVSALGKIGHPDALKPVAGTLGKRGVYTRRSAAIALGQILPQAEPDAQIEYLNKITRLLRHEKDGTTRNFALISIGRVGGARDAAEGLRSACEKVLTDQFENGGRTTVRPFAALGLGLLCLEVEKGRKAGDLEYRVADRIRASLSEMRGDKVALGAQAIALGMIGDKSAGTHDLLVKILSDRGLERRLRGSAAIALGLIGKQSAREPIRAALRERQDRELRVDTAVAAGLLGDPDAVKLLVDVLGDRKSSQFVLGSVALALGQIGDAAAVSPLVKILEPKKVDAIYPDLTRALVAVALGQIADSRQVRILFRLSKDANYRASVSALEEVLTIL